MRITPLGGLGEVGRNMTVFELDDRLLVVDCGVLFPEEDQPGVDLILPDFSSIEDRLDDVVALVLTHGHEDHIGGVPYLLRLREDIPLVGSELTLAFVEAKLKEHRIRPVLDVVTEHEEVSYGPFDMEFVAVNHSIPDAMAVFIRTDAGNVLATGDFKVDSLPIDGRITDLRSFARFADEGVDLFCVDSTNAEVPGMIGHENQIGPVLDNVFAESDQQIIVASFASHVHRVQQVLDAAADHGRRVALVGRSMVRNMGIAAERGYLKVPDGVLIDARDLTSLPEDQRVLMVTGSQGEPMAALSRMAHGEHRTITVEPGDTVIFASSLIPGNENSVYRVINQLMRLGARVVHQGNAKVHVSGHASSEELLHVYNIVGPRNVMPIHGEIRHLVANGALAVKTGIPPQNVMLCEDGVAVDLKDGTARIAGQVPCGYVYVDGSSVGEIDETELKDRRILASEGFVSVYAVVETKTGTILAGPDIQARGVAEDDAVFDEIIPDVTDALQEALDKGNQDAHSLQQVMRRTLGRFVGRRLKRRPMIVPVVIEA
ncbi:MULTISPECIES: ribonuclease J [unclassified Actinomyces]|uniref:ribonuclease J n=1 Tax=unclassified Actinomyces TaxID=2609248 RepID=UPI00201794DD|nr:MULTISPECIES: ribonuclease J [unclassified Actinomyces]MCL3776736.1 ribonuclease J [Actinomyces sp. AC-20-1]MCL3790856.1 ribonuclease J [Actinomyces sp. 187325]MCL3791875.1 ribonuclease J [Actinomyces sp. 186855]MCL3794464.1 ribonuclease J [Actinomyces sp. 217892]